MKLLIGLAGALLSLTPGMTVAEGEGKFGALAFGDIYYVAANHDSTLEDENGMWFRRVYLTYDHKFDDALSARIQLEMNHPGDFSTRSSMTAYVKDAWLKYTYGLHAASIGIVPAPALSGVEELWGYRHLEKAPLELQRLVSSRDLGVSFQGAFDEEKHIAYHIIGGTGSGIENETNEKKKGGAAIRVKPVEHLVLEVYGDYEDRVGSADRTTAHALLGWMADEFRAGVQYGWQNRNTVGEDTEISLISGFAAGAVTEKVWLVGRVDRNLDPNPDGDAIAYIPFSSEAANTFILAGVDFRVRETISLIPNVEAIVYDEPEAGGEAPDTDVMPRLTFFWKF